ncbi:MAG: hypothetical protein NTU49_01200 [Gammaproteobacteria bacterium]|nr:hypothetical protein [Gammaproteobacteria bacterium]
MHNDKKQVVPPKVSLKTFSTVPAVQEMLRRKPVSDKEPSNPEPQKNRFATFQLQPIEKKAEKMARELNNRPGILYVYQIRELITEINGSETATAYQKKQAFDLDAILGSGPGNVNLGRNEGFQADTKVRDLLSKIAQKEDLSNSPESDSMFRME